MEKKKSKGNVKTTKRRKQKPLKRHSEFGSMVKLIPRKSAIGMKVLLSSLEAFAGGPCGPCH